jgi:transglutaminase-like putative cysteine protease
MNRRFAGLGARVANRTATAAPPPTAEQQLLLATVLRDMSGWLRSGLAGGAQRLAGDTLDIRRLTPAETRPQAALPEPGNALVPTRAAEIKALAARLKGSDTDGRRTADRILRWVRTGVPGTSDSGAVDALQALRRRRGGPSDRAALFAALAQAAGLETRAVSGVVAVRDGGWARHAWAEVLLGDWVPVDPTYGTFPAGGGYVRLLLGAPADPLYLVPLAASLDLERLTRQKAR